MDPLVLHSVSNGVGTLIINRPKALNALNPEIVNDLHRHLRTWSSPGTHGVNCVVIKGAGGKAFCAGGDVKAAVEAAQTKAHLGMPLDFFTVEYAVVKDIAELPIPYVAIADGIVMGGGAGLAMNGSFRVVTERSMFAMPECGIGLFPDVAASFFLQRVSGAGPGPLGLYLGLTGARLNGMELKQCGLATHFVPSASLPRVEAALHQMGAAARDFGAVNTVLSQIEAESASGASASIGPSLAERMPHIARHFGHASVPEIQRSLEAARGEPGLAGAFAKEALASLAKGSPLSQLITFELLRRAKYMTLAETLALDLHLIALFIADKGDWFEGVRVTLVDKGQTPRWKYANTTQVPREVVDAFFTGMPPTISAGVAASKL